jgi:multimeric flavodoxin WrbA
MPTLLVVHHTPSPAMAEMFDAAVSGARTDEVPGVEVIIRPALTAGAADVLGADGYLLGTPANIGYMSGALKHFFDQIYYPAWRPPGGGRSACTCTAAWTPAARSGRSSRSPAACSGARYGRRSA